ncbi:hypothetical protein GWI33_020834 [Rhynchophorus ferrugineus]|uniref:Uncharacterized protein n=1 Tax=Rhynchophorus ferrugineus TaxID=354439 RepID=A0A834LZ31_RHYFE|nr:hypothetical protein GWI33_020834 [Rhynchophorus ferrugineus]
MPSLFFSRTTSHNNQGERLPLSPLSPLSAAPSRSSSSLFRSRPPPPPSSPAPPVLIPAVAQVTKSAAVGQGRGQKGGKQILLEFYCGIDYKINKIWPRQPTKRNGKNIADSAQKFIMYRESTRQHSSSGRAMRRASGGGEGRFSMAERVGIKTGTRERKCATGTGQETGNPTPTVGNAFTFRKTEEKKRNEEDDNDGKNPTKKSFCAPEYETPPRAIVDPPTTVRRRAEVREPRSIFLF